MVGSHVWAEDPEVAWIDGQVTEINGKEATILTTNGKTVSQYHFHQNWKAIHMSFALHA